MSAGSYLNLKMKSKEKGFNQLHDWLNHSFQEKSVSPKRHHPKNQKVVDVVVEEMEAIQLQEEEVQHMGSKGELVVEAVKSATNYTTKNRVLKYHLQWKKAIVASEVLSKPKSMR